VPHLAALDEAPENDAAAIAALAGIGGAIEPVPFLPAIADFYLTNPIARASKVMAECSALAHGARQAAAE
jgi:NADH-quinone oxidoreductase subunit G